MKGKLVTEHWIEQFGKKKKEKKRKVPQICAVMKDMKVLPGYIWEY